MFDCTLANGRKRETSNRREEKNDLKNQKENIFPYVCLDVK